MRNRYLIAYDVSDDKRRNSVFTTLMANGDHVQFSVFLCELNDMELARLKVELLEAINNRQDQVLILDMGDANQKICPWSASAWPMSRQSGARWSRGSSGEVIRLAQWPLEVFDK